MTTIAWSYGFPQVTAQLNAMAALPSGWNWYHVQSFGDELIALGTDATRFVSAKLTSVGGTWTLGTPTTDADLLVEQPDGLARISGLYAADLHNGKVTTSTNGLSWTVSTHDMPVVSIAYFGIGAVGNTFYSAGLNVVGGGDTTQSLVSSTNGVNWTLVDSVITNGTNWQPSGPPVALSGGVYIPQAQLSGAINTPYSKYSGGFTQHAHTYTDQYGTSTYTDFFTAPPPTVIAAGVLMGMTTPGNAPCMGVLTAVGANPIYIATVLNSDPTIMRTGGWGNSGGLRIQLQYPGSGGADGAYTNTNVFDPIGLVAYELQQSTPTGLTRVDLSQPQYDAGYAAKDDFFVGPLDGTAVIPFLNASAALELYAAPISTAVTPVASIPVTTFPTTYTGVTLNTQYGTDYVAFLASALGQNIYRAGALVFVVTPPVGAASIKLTFPGAAPAGLYIDIFAAQNSSYAALSDNYDADYYGYLYSAPATLDAAARAHVIPVTGTAPLTIVLQVYDAQPSTGGFDVRISLTDTFWTDLVNSETT